LAVPSIIRLDILFEALSGLFTLIIASVALFAWTRVRSRTLLLFSLSFYLMAAAMFLRVFLVSWAFSQSLLPPPLRLFIILILQLQEIIYSSVRLVAYLVLMYLYTAYTPKGEKNIYVIAPFSLIYNPFFEIVSSIILAFVVYRVASTLDRGLETAKALVLIGYILLMASHIIFFLTPLSINFYFIAHITQFLSLTFILLSVLDVILHGERL